MQNVPNFVNFPPLKKTEIRFRKILGGEGLKLVAFLARKEEDQGGGNGLVACKDKSPMVRGASVQALGLLKEACEPPAARHYSMSQREYVKGV